MRDYLTIAEKIEDLSLKTSDEVIGMPLIIKCVANSCKNL